MKAERQVVQVRIEWGGITAYVDAGLFPYCWDGELTVAGGRVRRMQRLQLVTRQHGIKSERHLPMTGTAWRSLTLDSMDGVLAEIEGTPASRVTVTTTQATVTFTLGELIARRYLRWPVGAKYAGILIRAMIDGDWPFQVDAAAPRGCLDVRFGARDFRQADVVQWLQREPGAWVAPGRRATLRLSLPRLPYREPARRSRLELELRLAFSSDRNVTPLMESCPAEIGLRLNGRSIPIRPFLYRGIPGWANMVWIEFLPVMLPDTAPVKRSNLVEIENRTANWLVLTGGQLRETVTRDLEIQACPPWVRAGETFEIAILALRPHAQVEITWHGLTPVAPQDNNIAGGQGLTALPAAANKAGRGLPELGQGVPSAPLLMHLPAGVHRLRFTAGAEPVMAAIAVRDGDAGDRRVIPVFAMPAEPIPWKVGATLETLRYERGGELDRFLDYARDTRLGNYFQFRINPLPNNLSAWPSLTTEDWNYWGRRFRELDMYFSMVGAVAWNHSRLWGDDPSRAIYQACAGLKATGGDFFFSTHFHELSMWLYTLGAGAHNPDATTPWTMQDAHAKYVQDYGAVEGVPGVRRQAGEACQVMAYDYESGIDVIAVEPNALNASQLYPAVRGAAKAYNKADWGTHCAVYWCKVPADETHLTLNYLTFYWTWLTGGNLAYSEDGHYNDYFSGTQAGPDSEAPVRLREIIRRFYRFVSTHPRRGRLRADLAVAQGQHACEICSFPLQFANFKAAAGHVWGAKATKEPKWAYSDAERGTELLDVFMPYWHQGQHIRHWFTGTPYGQFDITPVAVTPLETLRTYRVLVFLGWNTMTPELYQKLKAYVEQGGTLFMALPQMSLHVDRAFLKDLDDLNLICGGDFHDLFGVRIKGRKETARHVPATWLDAPAGRRGVCPAGWMYDLEANSKRGLTAEVELLGARPLVTAPKYEAPILVEHRLGQGRALLLTTWAYPGLAGLRTLMRDILYGLGEESLGDVRVEDASTEVAWSVWEEDHGTKTIGLLNTDWTAPGNVKSVRLVHAGRRIPLSIREGNLTLVTCVERLALWPERQDVYVESLLPAGARQYSAVLHGTGSQRLCLAGLKVRPAGLRWGGRGLAFRWNASDGVVDFAVNFGRATRGELGVQLR